LNETNVLALNLRGLLNIRQARGRKDYSAPTKLDGCVSHGPSPRIPGPRDVAPIDLDPGPKLVSEPESVSSTQRLTVVDPGRRWLVVVQNSPVEWCPKGRPVDRLRRDPGHRSYAEPDLGHAAELILAEVVLTR
jgi:hypothetical protein